MLLMQFGETTQGLWVRGLQLSTVMRPAGCSTEWTCLLLSCCSKWSEWIRIVGKHYSTHYSQTLQFMKTNQHWFFSHDFGTVCFWVWLDAYQPDLNSCVIFSGGQYMRNNWIIKLGLHWEECRLIRTIWKLWQAEKLHAFPVELWFDSIQLTSL